MKKLKTIVAAVSVGTIIAVGSLVSVTSASAESVETTRSVSTSYSPEQVFKGVYFLQGDIGQLIYEGSFLEELDGFSAGASVVNDEKFTTFTDNIVAEIEKADPNFLAEWSKRVTSGNPYIVERALAAGNAAMSETSAVIDANKDSETYVPGSVGPDCAVAVVVAAGFVIAAGAFVVVGAVGMSVVVFGYNVFVADNAVYTHPSMAANSSDLATQEWNALLTSRLAS